MAKSKWKLIGDYPIQSYKCGLVARQKLRLKKGYEVFCTDGTPTGIHHATGEIWAVTPGVDEEKIVVWLRDAQGKRCTWDDDPSIFDDFELVDKKLT